MGERLNCSAVVGRVADGWTNTCRGKEPLRPTAALGGFFHPDGERGASRNRRESQAKALCHDCPMRAECAAHALAVREPYGVWGGFTESERLRLLASGWEEAAERHRSRVDIRRLERRLSRSS